MTIATMSVTCKQMRLPLPNFSARISFLSDNPESSGRHNRQCLLGYKRDDSVLEIRTQWVRNKPAFLVFFNSSLKVDFQGSRIASDAGLLLVRELDEWLGLSQLISDNLSDARRCNYTQPPLPDMLRQWIYTRLAGYEDLSDAKRLSQDPTFRMLGSEKIRDRRAALQSRLHWFETQC